jgi:hypothetical protein
VIVTLVIGALVDVRALMGHLPEDHRQRSTWQYVAQQLADAAASRIDTIHVEVSLRLVLTMEGVECRPQ